MARHDFGIMEQMPVHGERYDSYEPWEYSCISVDDDFIEPFLSKLASIDSFWHSVDVPGKGLAYCGITLIPPRSIGTIIQIIDEIPELSCLKKLLSAARTQNKYVIHFGI